MTAPEITIRPVTADDSDILWLMLYYAAHMDEEDNKTINDAKTDSFLRHFVEDWGHPTDLGFIAEKAGQAIGGGWVRLFPDETYPELAIAVLPDYIGQGIGTSLLNTIISACSKQFKGIMLSVRANNPAYHLYQRSGFQTIMETTNRVGTSSYEMLLIFNAPDRNTPEFD